MKMNRIELKEIMSDFNRHSSRLLQADYNDYIDALKRFLNFIETNEFINNFIQDCGGFCAEFEEDFNKVVTSGNAVFRFSLDDKKETSEIYSLIKLICDKNYNRLPHSLLFAYSPSQKYNDMLKVFNHRVIVAFINHIEGYMTKVGIEMGLDTNVTYNINGNQVNVANDNATINATQNNGIDPDELKKLMGSMRESLSTELSDEDKKEAEECIDIIEQELQSNTPNEEKVKTRFKLLRRIDGGVKFASACCSLLTLADKIFPFLGEIVPLFSSLL